MKKKILLAVIIFVGCIPQLFAQHHSYADTSYYHYWQFDPEEWVRLDSQSHYLYVNCDYHPYYGIFKKLQYNFTDNPQGVEVAGVTICAGLGIAPASPVPLYAYLYDSDVDTFVLKDSVPFDPRGDTRHLEQVLFNQGLHPDSCSKDCYRRSENLFWYDLYFDQPIRVYDSFYVGMDVADGFYSNNGQLTESPFILCTYESIHGFDDTCTFPPILWKYYMTHLFSGCESIINRMPLNRWCYMEQTEFFMLVLPILAEYDTTADPPPCPMVSNFRIYRHYGDEVTLKWNANGGTMWEVSHGVAGTAPEYGIKDTVTSPQWITADTTHADTISVAYVRTICTEYDTLRYTEWSRGLIWAGSRVSIEQAPASPSLKLVPNPAHDKVALVGLPEGKSQVEVFDSRGALVLTATASPAENTVDISLLPNGCYLLKAINMGVTSTAKVVVTKVQ